MYDITKFEVCTLSFDNFCIPKITLNNVKLKYLSNSFFHLKILLNTLISLLWLTLWRTIDNLVYLCSIYLNGFYNYFGEK